MWLTVRAFDDESFVDRNAGRIDVRAKGIKAAERVVKRFAQGVYRAVSEYLPNLYRI
jgi:hypothetical protein